MPMYFLSANILDTIHQSLVSFSWRDALDVIIVAFLIYGFLLLLRRTHSRFVFNGICFLLLLYVFARVLNLYLTSLIFQGFFSFFIVILVVLFQREIRNFFEWLYIWGRLTSQKQETVSEQATDAIVETVTSLVRQKIGALIVFPGRQFVDSLVQGGVILNGRVSVPLLMSLFDPSSPGHDGAVIIETDRVKKFGVHLPLAEHFERYGHLGTRHRAALGLAERSDALVVVVSEERGVVSVAYESDLKQLEHPDDIKEKIQAVYKDKYEGADKHPWHYLITHNWREKLLALGFTILLWFVAVFRVR